VPIQRSQAPQVVFQPQIYRRFQRGIDDIVSAVRPTLGPCPRLVASARQSSTNTPELLDSGGIIARRITELPNRDENAGAMLVRHLLWRIYEQVGDGTATAAVIFQAVYKQSVPYIIAGGSPMLMRRYLERGAQLIRDELAGMVRHVEGREQLARIAESICHERELAELLGEIFDIIGEHGQVEIRSSAGRGLDREYVEGMHWAGGLLSREMVIDAVRMRVDLESVGILISDLDIDDPLQLVPVIEMALQAGIRSLVIVANRLSDRAIGLLVANRDAGAFQVMAVKAPGLRADEQAAALEDLAVLTGGRRLLRAAGDQLGRVRIADLGRARRAWANKDHFGIVGGKGDPHELRRHVACLRAAYAVVEDPRACKLHRQRLGRLCGGAATLWVGGATESDITIRKDLAGRAAEALRGAIAGGVLPGAGVALLACRPALRRALEQSDAPDERAAYRVLLDAISAPIHTIASNAGYDARAVMTDLAQAGCGYGFDALSGQIVDAAHAGILDVAATQQMAICSAIDAAALALTIDVLVHRAQPEMRAANP